MAFPVPVIVAKMPEGSAGGCCPAQLALSLRFAYSTRVLVTSKVLVDWAVPNIFVDGSRVTLEVRAVVQLCLWGLKHVPSRGSMATLKRFPGLKGKPPEGRKPQEKTNRRNELEGT